VVDGSLVQELNTDLVPSKRRNPVIADVFSMMNYMERRGSGFKKIKADYHRAVNFREVLEPQFYSDRNNFIVTLFNLNYGVEIGKTGLQEQKQDFIQPETGLQEQKQDFEIALGTMCFTQHTIANILALHQQYGTEYSFSRVEVMKLLDLSASPASALLARMKEAGLIELANGKSRGVYRFKKI